MNGDPVEFTPGGGKDFTLNQEHFQTPEAIAYTQAAAARAAELVNKIQNSQGFWKNKYQAELAQLQSEFGNELGLYGARTAQEAIGVQPLYEGQVQGRMPVQKVFDPRIEALRRK